MEQVADRTVRYLYERFRMPGQHAADEPACALVRMFVTMPFVELTPDQQAFAEEMLGGASHPPRMKCLTLLATAGQASAWNSRHSSAGHKALPLASVESIARAPMIAQLIRQLGVEVGTLLSSDTGVMVDAAQRTFNVFYIPEAKGSPHIPAQQDFVVPHGIRSVIGFGGVLPPGEMYATILFTRVSIPREVADLFKTLALNIKVALLPFAGGKIFA